MFIFNNRKLRKDKKPLYVGGGTLEQINQKPKIYGTDDFTGQTDLTQPPVQPVQPKIYGTDDFTGQTNLTQPASTVPNSYPVGNGNYQQSAQIPNPAMDRYFGLKTINNTIEGFLDRKNNRRDSIVNRNNTMNPYNYLQQNNIPTDQMYGIGYGQNGGYFKDGGAKTLYNYNYNNQVPILRQRYQFLKDSFQNVANSGRPVLKAGGELPKYGLGAVIDPDELQFQNIDDSFVNYIKREKDANDLYNQAISSTGEEEIPETANWGDDNFGTPNLTNNTQGDWASMFRKAEDPQNKFNHGNGAFGSFGFRKTGHLQQAFNTDPGFNDIKSKFGSYDNFWNTFTKSGYGSFSNVVDKKYSDWLKRETNGDIKTAAKYNLTGDKNPRNNWMVGKNMPWQRYVKEITGSQSSSPAGNFPFRLKNNNVNIANLNPNLTNFAKAAAQKFPGLVVTSGNDSKHMHGSRHYGNKAIDIGANSSNKEDYNKFKELLRNPQALAAIKRSHGIEDIIDEGDHIHIELHQNGGYKHYKTGGVYYADSVDQEALKRKGIKFRYI